MEKIETDYNRQNSMGTTKFGKIDYFYLIYSDRYDMIYRVIFALVVLKGKEYRKEARNCTGCLLYE